MQRNAEAEAERRAVRADTALRTAALEAELGARERARALEDGESEVRREAEKRERGAVHLPLSSHEYLC